MKIEELKAKWEELVSYTPLDDGMGASFNDKDIQAVLGYAISKIPKLLAVAEAASEIFSDHNKEIYLPAIRKTHKALDSLLGENPE